MGAAKKIVITHVQSMKVHRILKADKGNTPLQDFIDLLATEGEVEPWIAEKFATAWRYHHRNDNSNPEPETQPKQQQPEETFFVKQPLPKRQSTNSTGKSDPAEGTGIVAQIIAHAESGKSTKEIIELGYNKSTVYRQYSEWKKRKAAAREKNVAVA